MDIIDEAKNIFSGGKSNELKSIELDYKSVLNEYENKFSEIEHITKNIEREASIISKYQKKIEDMLPDAEVVVENIPHCPKHDSINKISIDIEQATLMDDMQEIAKATFQGTNLAVASWSVVSILGTASTGASIASLSGVAGTNAILAWFGGGSLAVGGAGIVGGTMVLSGIAVVPALFLFHKNNNRKLDTSIKEYSSAIQALEERTKEYLKIKPSMQSSLSVMKAYSMLLVQHYDRSNGLMSKVKIKPQTFMYKLKNFFRIPIYTKLELESIKNLPEEITTLKNIFYTDFSSYKGATNDRQNKI